MSQNVLIVDDSPLMRKMLRRVFKMAELDFASIHEAGNGIEALAVFATEQVDLAFVDINMPEMNGLELIQRLAETGKLQTTKVVVISTERNEGRIDRLKRLGIHYLPKPFRPEDVCMMIDQILGESEIPR
jgi:two-component system chemotaxis response regulator CheY